MREKLFRAVISAALITSMLLTSFSLSSCKDGSESGGDTSGTAPDTGTADTGSETGSNDTEPDADTTTGSEIEEPDGVVVGYQVYYGDESGNLVRIPEFAGKDKNSETDKLNARIKSELVDYYNTLTLPDPDGKKVYQFNAYINSGESYIQVLSTVTESSVSATDDGKIYSYVYDVKAEKALTAEDGASLAAVTQDDAEKAVESFLNADNSSDLTLKSLKLAAFELPMENLVSLYYYAALSSESVGNVNFIYSLRVTDQGTPEVIPLYTHSIAASETEPVTEPVSQPEPDLPEPDKIVVSDKPAQTDMKEGNVNAYHDKASGVKITFPASFTVQLAYENGYAAFTNAASTDSVTYLVESGAHLDEIKADNKNYKIADGTDGSAVFERVYTSFTERWYVREIGGNTVWVVLCYAAKSASGFKYQAGDITITEVK